MECLGFGTFHHIRLQYNQKVLRSCRDYRVLMNEHLTESIVKVTEISRIQRPARLLTERPPGVRRPGRRKYAERLGDARPLSVASEPCGSTRNEPCVCYMRVQTGQISSKSQPCDGLSFGAQKDRKGSTLREAIATGSF